MKYYNYLKVFLIFSILFFLFSKNSFSNECLNKKELNIGLIDNDFIDYKYYLYYALGEYSSINNIQFTISEVDHNANEFDIIFGEFRDLEKLSLNQTIIPDEILTYYFNNDVEIFENLFPLDLDTFILLSQDDHKKLTFEELSEVYNPIKYTLGMTLETKGDIVNLFTYQLGKPYINIDSLSFDTTVNLFSKTYKNLNKNILDDNFLEIYNSYENLENVYTLFNDGILLYKNINFKSFQLFPKSKYVWNEENGIFKENIEIKPFSFYGFSAYLNNTESSGFLCYLIDEEVRLKAFKDFNIQLSPLSVHEVRKIENELPDKYLEILEKKNKYIFKPNYSSEIKNYELLLALMLGEEKISNIFNNQDYLNR